jgi:hypothetical protein
MGGVEVQLHLLLTPAMMEVNNHSSPAQESKPDSPIIQLIV